MRSTSCPSKNRPIGTTKTSEALERAGTPIGANDMLIAAHALALGLTLVTNNTREFGRVAGLRVENWLDQ
jgi:predicted nucleic acid-binding protein